MTATNYYFWGLANRVSETGEGLEPRAFPRRPTPDPRDPRPISDWAWSEWVQEQGIGE